MLPNGWHVIKWIKNSLKINLYWNHTRLCSRTCFDSTFERPSERKTMSGWKLSAVLIALSHVQNENYNCVIHSECALLSFVKLLRPHSVRAKLTMKFLRPPMNERTQRVLSSPDLCHKVKRQFIIVHRVMSIFQAVIHAHVRSSDL